MELGFSLSSVGTQSSWPLAVGPPVSLSWGNSSLAEMPGSLMSCCNDGWLLTSFGKEPLYHCGQGPLCGAGHSSLSSRGGQAPLLVV